MRKLLAFSLSLVLVSAASAQTSAPGAEASLQQGKAKVVFYYSRPVPLKNCLEQVGIQIDGVTVHQIFQWHVWQTEVSAGTHVFSDDSHKDKGITSSLAAGQTYYYQLQWHKAFGFPKCDNFFTKVEDMKPKEIQKATALLGKPGMDETAASQPPPVEIAKATGQKLLIESIPERADIEVDGNFRGNTPSAVELSAGDHIVVVSKNGYKSWQRKIKLGGGDVKVSAELEKDASQ
jgi:PEGA domain-containing protein